MGRRFVARAAAVWTYAKAETVTAGVSPISIEFSFSTSSTGALPSSVARQSSSELHCVSSHERRRPRRGALGV